MFYVLIPWDSGQCICIDVGFSLVVVNGEIELGMLDDPLMSSRIQLGHGQNVDQRVVVRVHCKGGTVQALLEAFGNSPL